MTQTVTTDTYFDSVSTLTAGEDWLINSGQLTIRTDTRWHANSPAGMTGSLGIMYLQAKSSKLHVDGTKVRWIQFSSATGTVPAVGSTLTQGSVTGYILGVWADYISAPLAVGTTMPSTGYIKLREVTGGTFVTNSATASSGITAINVTPDVVGWIEVVMDQTKYVNFNFPDCAGFSSLGDWFDLGTTTGVRGQVIQLPTNGGGSGTVCGGVQIETAPGSGVYEWWPTMLTALFISTNISSDVAEKVLNNAGNGQLIVGQNGANNIGALPVSGCKIRCPNIFLRTTTSANRALNTGTNAVSSKACISNKSTSTYVDLHNVMMDWACSIGNNKSWNIYDSSVDAFFASNYIVYDSGFYNVCVSRLYTSGSFALTGSLSTLTLSNVTLGSYSDSFQFLNCNVINVTNLTEYIYQKNYSSPFSFYVSKCNVLNVDGVTSVGAHCVYAQTVGTINLKNADLTATGFAATDSSNGSFAYLLYATSSNYINIEGVTFGKNGEYGAGRQPHIGLTRIENAINVSIKNIGTRSSPVPSYGINTAAYSFANLVNFNSSNIQSLTIKRVFFTGMRSSIFTNTSKFCSNFLLENVYLGYVNGNFSIPADVNTVKIHGCNGTYISGSGSSQGTMFNDLFLSDTTGKIYCYIAAPLASNQSLVTLTDSQTAYFSTNGVNLTGLNDTVTMEMSYSALGITGFQNSAATITGSGLLTNHTVYYQIDKGTGWNGTWKLASGANLSGETGIDPSIGVKLKLKIVCIVANSANWVGAVEILTTSTLTAQTDNMYPLDTYTLAFTGLAPGSEVRCYSGTDPATAVEIGGIESTAGSTFSFTHSSGGTDGYITIFALGYQPVRFNYTFKSSDDSVLIQPVVDRNYVNP